MLTPRFKVSQDDDFVTVNIYAPFTNVADTEVFMEEREFRFYSKPYYLRLHLPGEVEENDDASANYDAKTNSFVIKAPKKNKGEDFKGLEMVAQLLIPPATKENGGGGDISEVTLGGDDGDEWFFQQELPKEEEEAKEDPEFEENHRGYGFGLTRRNVFSRNPEAQEILDIKNPDDFSWSERRKLRFQKEQEDFSDDHYLCDLYESDEIQSIVNLPNSFCLIKDGDEEESFTKEEQERLVMLPREFPVVRKEHRQAVFYGLVDILLASCFDYLTTDGERSAESGWTISKLSATLSCCDKFDNLHDCVIAFMRRSLCYPLHRHFDLSLRCLKDVTSVLQSGNVAILKALIEIILLFVQGDRYLLNQLYIEPYLLWVQRVPSSHFQALAEALSKTLGDVTKDSVGLELNEIEHAAKLVEEEEEEEEGQQKSKMPLEDITKSLQRVKLDESDSDDDSSSDSDSDSSSSSDSEEESTSSEDNDSDKDHVNSEPKKTDTNDSSKCNEDRLKK